MNKKNCLFFIYMVLLVGIWANPFTGTQKSPAPIRSERPSAFITEQQARLHTQLGEYINDWAENNTPQAFWTIMWIAFFYGFMHALGPGHRKAIVFSFYLTKPAPLWEPLLTGSLLAALHGLTTVSMLLIFKNVKGALSVHTAITGVYLEGFSFFLLIILSILSILHIAAHTFPGRIPHIGFGCGCCSGTHTHHTDCSCGKDHIHTDVCPASDEKTELRTANSTNPSERTAEKIQWGTFVLSGIYPCPAAILVLVLVLSLDAIGLGIAAVVSMSIGMAVPITCVAYLAWAGRIRLFRRFSTMQHSVKLITFGLGVTAYTAILGFSLYAVLPFFKSLLR